MSVFSSRPPKLPDNAGAGGPSRAGAYSEAYTTSITNKELFSADEGSYWVAITPTAGTGIIGHAAPTTFDEAKATVVLYNSGSLNIYPQFVHFHETVASVGGSRVQWTLTLDTGNRRSSAGTALVTNNTNFASTNSTGLVGFIGAVVSTAATASRRLIGNYVFRGTIDIIEDSYEFNFGSTGGASYTGSRVATVADASRTLPPVVIPPGASLCMHQWAGSQSTGPTLECVLGYIER